MFLAAILVKVLPAAKIPPLNVCSAVKVFATEVVTPETAPVKPLNERTPVFDTVSDLFAVVIPIPTPAVIETPAVNPLIVLTRFPEYVPALKLPATVAAPLIPKLAALKPALTVKFPVKVENGVDAGTVFNTPLILKTAGMSLSPINVKLVGPEICDIKDMVEGKLTVTAPVDPDTVI